MISKIKNFIQRIFNLPVEIGKVESEGKLIPVKVRCYYGKNYKNRKGI